MNSYKAHLLKRLRNPKEAAAYLNAALEDKDPRVALIALKDIAEAHGGQETDLQCTKSHTPNAETIKALQEAESGMMKKL